jgi:hypothetical protein
MKYMLLISMKRESWEDMATWTPEDTKSVVGYMDVLLKELTETGEFISGEGLGGPARMTVVRAQPGGEPLVTDGPMAEAKEFLAGYMAIDVSSLDRAIEIAKRWSACPSPKLGEYPPIEIHPIMGDPSEDPDLLAPYKK